MKKVSDILKNQLKSQLQNVKKFWLDSDVSIEKDIEDLRQILECIKSNSIRFNSNVVGCDDSAIRRPLTTGDGRQKDVPKKRGRQTKTISSEPKGRSDDSDCISLNDSVSSTSSTRSRRAAAQAAEHKLAHVQSLSQLKTKLRRPTDFDEKQSKTLSSPPAKCRRTRRNQSAGSSSPQTEEGSDKIKEENHKIIVDNEKLGDECLNIECSVPVEKLNTPTIKSYTYPNTRSSRSLDRGTVRNSNDLFNDSPNLSRSNNKCGVQEAPNSDPTHKNNKKKSKSKKDLDSGISSTEEELQQLMKKNLPIAQSSPILPGSLEGGFKGFDDQPNNNKAGDQAELDRENTFVVSEKTEKTKVLLKRTVKSDPQEISSSEEVELTENNVIKPTTKVLRKKGAQTAVNLEEKENVNRNNETHIITSKTDDSPNVGSQTKVLKKDLDPSVKNNEDIEKNSEDDVRSLSSPEVKTRRTKTIRKQNEQHKELKSESDIAGRSLRTKTKTKKPTEKEEDSNSSDDEANNIRSRTKTIKKTVATNLPIIGPNSDYLISEFKDNSVSTKLNNRLPALSPAPAKGELVKKRVEDFEKMQNGTEQDVEEEKTVGRVTRNAMKNMVTSSVTEAQSSKSTRNMPVSKVQASTTKLPLSSERPRMTPLGNSNRMTPACDSALKIQANKWTNSANRPTPIETNSVTLIHKQAVEEADKKKKEEERLKRQTKEEDAKKKKEKALKATADEARRKRLEKLQKVAAAREAAEKEKERTVAKAEKEKVEKMRQIAIEKEKQKEEQLKKKQLTQQKMLEHEERRRQEEAARLAKLKEQEEEHKRLLAMKEREQELHKQQKEEQRLAEAEKTKQQGGKLGKIAAVNSAKLKMQGMTPSNKTNCAQSTASYEITPARDDRPLLPSKSENDYGIDDAHSGDSSEDESQPRKIIPAWAQSKKRERLLLVNKYIPKMFWDKFMECNPCPDINQMFAGNPIKKRIRTSSAVWRTPPKYSRIAS